MNHQGFQKFCASSGVICVVLFFGAFVLAGFMPPVPAFLHADQVAAIYREQATGIRSGMALMLLSSTFYGLFSAAIAGQMQRIPGVTPTAVFVQIVSGAVACLTFMLPAIFFIVASFRPERSPELTQIFNDLGWITVVIPWMPFMAQNFTFAFSILGDKRPQPLFPRWLAYLNFWASITFTPAILLPFFKSGPFAWDGVLVFWIPAAVFVFWFAMMARMLLRAIGRQEP